VKIGKIFFDKLAITNTAGAVTVKDGRVAMQKLGMNLLDGSMTINGEYNTQNIKVPFIDFGLDIRQFDISSALSSFSMLEKILPEPQNYAGKVSASLTLNSALDGHLSPVLDSVVSKGSLQTQNLQIRNSKIFGSVADFLKNENWRNPSPGNISVGFEIKDGRVWIEKPIVMNMPPARMEISGDMGLDTSLNYKIDTIVPTSAIGSGAASLLSSIPGGSRINQIKVTGLVRGTAKNPEVSLSMADMASSITDAVKDQVVQTVTKKAEEVKTQVSAEVNRQIDQLIAEAQKQATNIRTAAKQAADKTRRDSNAAADKLISDASKKSVLEKQVAKVAADKLRTEGEASAKKLEQEGEKNAQAALTAAQKKADELKKK
ncbi:MAG: hypothetical protein LBG95_00070, partial [Treponema sp.]|nr:hypothetical protein [Treponema sp.]